MPISLGRPGSARLPGKPLVTGVPLGEAVRRLIKEHEINRIMLRYEELRADPEEWASYRAEARLTDQAAGDGLPDAAGDDHPEYGSEPTAAHLAASTTEIVKLNEWLREMVAFG